MGEIRGTGGTPGAKVEAKECSGGRIDADDLVEDLEHLHFCYHFLDYQERIVVMTR